MIRCPEGHFYDPAKHPGCPWCGVAAKAGAEEADAGKTKPMRAVDAPGAAAPARAAEHGVTKALYREPTTGVSPVIGWLVCIDGPDKGRDYRLHAEKNFIGRSTGMDVALMGDDSISREKHATVTFDPKKKTFWLAPGDSSGLVYLNDELVNTPTQMKGEDVLELGKTKLVLVPLTSPKAEW